MSKPLDPVAFPSVANPNEHGELSKLIAVPFVIIAAFVALVVLLRGLQRLHSLLFGPRYFGD